VDNDQNQSMLHISANVGGAKIRRTDYCIRTNIGRCESKECSPECAKAFLREVVQRLLDEAADHLAELVVERVNAMEVFRG
jgi:hypothetical protein